MALNTSLEKQTCGRCGGSGQYSYCQMYGTTCFGCGGKGEVLTKRGHAANTKLIELRSKRADQIKPGEAYRMDGFCAGSFSRPTMWVTVEAVEADASDPNRIHIKGDKSNYNCFTTTMLRVRQSKEDSERTLAEALAYQATLTQQGKPRKRPAKATA